MVFFWLCTFRLYYVTYTLGHRDFKLWDLFYITKVHLWKLLFLNILLLFSLPTVLFHLKLKISNTNKLKYFFWGKLK